MLAPTFLQIKPFLGTMLGIFGAVVLILSAIILVVRLKSSSRRRDRARAISNTITMSSTLSPSHQNGGVILREASSADSIDKNPDIIPQGMICVIILRTQAHTLCLYYMDGGGQN